MNFYPKRRRAPQIIIVSLIDIFAILLIFVLVSTQFRKPQPAVTIRLPEAKSSAVAQPKREPVVLTIAKDSALFLDEKPVTLEQLTPLLSELVRREPETMLALNADKEAPFGVVVKVLDGVKEAGVKGSLTAFMDRSK
ncbi:MAG: biopolymer transport protein ExbD [Verrucomicrobiota bacterium]|jgi:biopolymer transport protein ExbD